MNFAFLILHYNEIELTDRAVKSILAMDVCDNDRLDIVIVDNCSPNGSGKKLIELYNVSPLDVRFNQEVFSDNVSQSTTIHVILNTENGGFSKGNNVGYSYIKNNLNTDFVIALNNDISFPQKDFVDRLKKIYENEESRFYLAGPDVYTPNIRSHISPLDAKCKDENDVEARFKLIDDSIAILEKKFDFATFTRFLQDKYQGTKLLEIYNKLRGGEYEGATKHDKPAYDCVLNGACLIFDKRYVEENEVLFEEKTFLYAEEDFLTYRLVKQGKMIRYCPELVVSHVGQGSAGFGTMNYRKYCDKNIKTQERTREAFKVYLQYLRDNN